MRTWLLSALAAVAAAGAILAFPVGAAIASRAESWRVTLYTADGAVLRTWDVRQAPEVDGRCARWPDGAVCGGAVVVERRTAP